MDRQRIDKWLWFARVVRTRTSAAALVTAGRVRLNGQRSAVASQIVRVGDVVTVALDRAVRVLRVIGFAERRGAPESVQSLYEDISPAAPEVEPAPLPLAAREPGMGRPTKRDRRVMERFRTGEE